MRISDWSSDVCSSDLAEDADVVQQGDPERRYAGNNGNCQAKSEGNKWSNLTDIHIGHSSSSTAKCVSDRHRSTGIISVKIITSFIELAATADINSTIPTTMAAPTVSG